MPPSDRILNLGEDHEHLEQQLQAGLGLPARTVQSMGSGIATAAAHQLQEYAANAGIQLDLRPGTIIRQIVDSFSRQIHVDMDLARQVHDDLLIRSRRLPDPIFRREFLPSQIITVEETRRRLEQQAREDALVYDALDRISHPQFIEVSLVTDPPDPRATIQGRHVTMPEFELTANPTICIDDIRTRRSILDRFRLSPQAPPPPKPHIFYPTAWEHLLNDPDF